MPGVEKKKKLDRGIVQEKDNLFRLAHTGGASEGSSDEGWKGDRGVHPEIAPAKRKTVPANLNSWGRNGCLGMNKIGDRFRSEKGVSFGAPNPARSEREQDKNADQKLTGSWPKGKNKPVMDQGD